MDPTTDKYLYAIQVEPITTLTNERLYAIPPNTTNNPYANINNAVEDG